MLSLHGALLTKAQHHAKSILFGAIVKVLSASNFDLVSSKCKYELKIMPEIKHPIYAQIPKERNEEGALSIFQL